MPESAPYYFCRRRHVERAPNHRSQDNHVERAPSQRARRHAQGVPRGRCSTVRSWMLGGCVQPTVPRQPRSTVLRSLRITKPSPYHPNAAYLRSKLVLCLLFLYSLHPCAGEYSCFGVGAACARGAGRSSAAVAAEQDGSTWPPLWVRVTRSTRGSRNVQHEAVRRFWR